MITHTLAYSAEQQWWGYKSFV